MHYTQQEVFMELLKISDQAQEFILFGTKNYFYVTVNGKPALFAITYEVARDQLMMLSKGHTPAPREN